MATMPVKDANGSTVQFQTPPAPGRLDASASRAMVLSTEDYAVLQAIVAAIEDNSGSGGDASAANQATGNATLASILAKLIEAPSTEAKQDAGNTSLASVDTKLSGTNSKLDVLHTDLATTLAGFLDGLEALIGTTNAGNSAILAKLIAGPATEATLASILTSVDGLEGLAAAATPAGELHIGQVGGHTAIVDVTLSLDTAAYASGDVLADTQVVTNAMRVNDGTGVLNSLTVVDQDDQGVAFDVYILSGNVVMGTENAAPSITDADALNILTRIQVAASDFTDLGGVKVATLSGLQRTVKAAAGTRNLYVAVVNGTGAPTFTAAGIKLRLGFLQD